MARSPLFHALRRALRLARMANRPGAPPADELAELHREAGLSRRRFLRLGGGMALAAATLPMLEGCFLSRKKAESHLSDNSYLGTNPRVVIVGGGLAGLTTAYYLRKGGLIAQVFEASPRYGGRVMSRSNVVAADLVTELGGEFIDSNHDELLALAVEFNLSLLDVEGEKGSLRTAYYFAGMHHSEAEVIEALRPLAYVIELDASIVEGDVSFEYPGLATKLDKMSLAQYLSRIGASGWVRQLLEAAFVTEYGLEASEQSSLNLLKMMSTDLSSGKLELFGESDERYKIMGGNEKVSEALARAVGGQVSTGQTLESIRQNGSGYSMVFRTANGTAKVIAAEVVVLTLPFTKLRNVELGVELPAVKRRAIMELGYGSSAKVFMGFVGRPWRTNGYTGEIFSDGSCQLAWDNSMGQESGQSGLTVFHGGKRGTDCGKADLNVMTSSHLRDLNLAFEGLDMAYNGRADRFHWPTQPFTLGGYSAYRPGQWTSIGGAEGFPVGNLYFAGEHCSRDFQGFMNGAVETGRSAAEAILQRVRK